MLGILINNRIYELSTIFSTIVENFEKGTLRWQRKVGTVAQG